MIEDEEKTMSTNPSDTSSRQGKIGQLETNLEGQFSTYNTEDKGGNDELIKFCESIPKKPTGNSIFEKNKNKYIKHLAKTGKIKEIMEANKGDSTEDNDLNIQQLVVAFQAEMDIFKYLMSKHKNSRALAFVDIIVKQTYELWKEKCQKEIDKAIEEGTITIDITKNLEKDYDIITLQTANEHLDTIPKYRGRDELYKYKPDSKRFVETWYQRLVDVKEDHVENEEEEEEIHVKKNGKEQIRYMKGILNYHRGIQRGIDILREAAKKHRHTRGNIFADEFKKIVNASERVLNLACNEPLKLYDIRDRR